MNNTAPLTSLLNELTVKWEIVSFICPSDALHLTETCSCIQQDLSLSCLNPPYSLKPIQEWSGDADTRPGPRLPVLYPKRTHSITLKGRQWCGDGPCRVYLLAFDPNDQSVDTTSFSNGSVVIKSPIAQGGKVLKFTITFCPGPSMIYYLWYQGEVVQTNRIMVHTVIFDTPKRTISKENRRTSNPISPLRSMLVHTMWQAISVRG